MYVWCVCLCVLFPDGPEARCANIVLLHLGQPLAPVSAWALPKLLEGLWFQEPLVLTRIFAFKGIES